MKQTELQIADFIQSRGTALLMLIVGLAMLLSGSSLLPQSSSTGVDSALQGVGPVIASSYFKAVMAALAGGFFAISVMSLTNRTFAIMQSTSNLYVGLFALLAASMPGALGMGLDGTLLMATVLFCLMFMYTTYGRPSSTRRIYLVFTLLSAGSAIQYAFALYIPLMLIGCRQMRCFSLRSILAMLFGLITPYWIMWGFGLITLDRFTAPQIGWPTLDAVDRYSLPQLLGAAGMMVIAVATTLYNVVRIFGQNARTRAINGLLALTTLWTILTAIVDLGHLTVYMPLLAALTAINLTLYNHLGQQHRSYIAVALAVLLAITTFTWNLLG